MLENLIDAPLHPLLADGITVDVEFLARLVGQFGVVVVEGGGTVLCEGVVDLPSGEGVDEVLTGGLAYGQCHSSGVLEDEYPPRRAGVVLEGTGKHYRRCRILRVRILEVQEVAGVAVMVSEDGKLLNPCPHPFSDVPLQ